MDPRELNSTLLEAFHSHEVWKVRFHTAIIRGEPVDANLVADHDACQLGVLLNGPGSKICAGHEALYELICQAHAAFHQCARSVAEAINTRKIEEAHQLIGPVSPYAAASSALVDAVTALEQQISKPV